VSVSVNREGRILSVHDRFATASARIAAPRAPLIAPEEAIGAAALALGLELAAPPSPVEADGFLTRIAPGARLFFEAAGASVHPVPVRLVYVRRAADEDEPERLRLAWNLVIRDPDGDHWWVLNVDALDASLLSRADWSSDAAYRVLPPPLRGPDEGDRALEVDPADPVASPFGWHDDDGVPGAEYTDTRGNNVLAQEDADGDDSGGFRPSGGAGLVFDLPADLAAAPEGTLSAGVTNLFYWANRLHDIHYRYGFDEAAGNFQWNDYGRGGVAGDPVYADAQDGAGLDNAQFFTPPDGAPGVLEMFLATLRRGTVEVLSPAELADSFSAGQAQFGPALGAAGPTGEVVRALDPVEGAEYTSTDACSPLTNAAEVAGRVALVDRGVCLFAEKVRNAEDAGAVAVLIANDQGEGIFDMSAPPEAPAVGIPSLLIPQSRGAELESALGSGVTARLSVLAGRSVRDLSFANDVIIHEYGHGVSNRLVGGPANTDCLESFQGAGMGEGWSDFWALALTATGEETRETPLAFGTYLSDDPPAGPGLRNYPYSTSFAVDPQTYADAPDTNRPHGVGEIWTLALWEVYWNLVDEYGFDPDYALGHAGEGGNTLMLQLVMDALPLSPCEPTFLDGRDALLLADLDLTGGANECAIWRGFARRGMGVGASDGGSAESTAIVESFDVPVACPEPASAALGAAALLSLLLVRQVRWRSTGT
jgi:extracellular elastinolytic metalloproteinase